MQQKFDIWLTGRTINRICFKFMLIFLFLIAARMQDASERKKEKTQAPHPNLCHRITNRMRPAKETKF